ncbi:Rha family transcriptional regulator [Microbacterium sp. 20-116]|uniref:Rha family transcriptional regulator n=1 Tax=Microbacterium sp. 20-116 TaxID=3239883 RepID=UPI0034E1CB15
MNGVQIIDRDGRMLVSSETIAAGAGVQHKNVLELVENSRADFEDFGPIAFETRMGVPLPQGGFARSTRIAMLNEEQATLLMTYQRNTEQVRGFKKALVRAFFEMRKAQAASSAPVALTRRDLALAVIAAEDEADRQRERAERAESVEKAIISSEGLSVREFHKHYFADTSEREFNQVLYTSGLLINQRGKGEPRRDGSFRDGGQHRHPGHAGKRFFYLDAGIAGNGHRFAQTRVRPGEPEIALVRYLAGRGLSATRAIADTAALGTNIHRSTREVYA